MQQFDPGIPFNNLPKLPPDFNFDEIEILKKVNMANMALSKLSGLAQSLPNHKLLIEPLSVREAVASSGIENINTTIEEVFQASLFDESKLTKEQKETLHYKDALLAGFEMIAERGFLNSNNFIQIQSILEPEKSGIRKVPGVKIMNSGTGEILYTPPENESIIRDLLKNLEEYFNDIEDTKTDALIKIAICHYQFESIHPFLDGNGRVGRILMVLQLILAKRIQSPILFLSGYINKNREEYYRLLRDVTSNGNWKNWIIYILTAIEKQSIETTSTIIKIRDLIQVYRGNIKTKLPKIYSADLLEFLFSFPFYTQKTLSKTMNINRNTSLKYLNALLNENFVKSFKLKKENVYFLSEFVDLLK